MQLGNGVCKYVQIYTYSDRNISMSKAELTCPWAFESESKLAEHFGRNNSVINNGNIWIRLQKEVS